MAFLRIIVIASALILLSYNQKIIDHYQEALSINRMIGTTDIPPSLTLTTFALGPLRALVVDALWWRAIRQQDRGEYFDALQLADWITKLQPTYASVWAFHSWNMAYNIAHDFARPEDRWQWIDHAITLLRDEGLKYNPDDPIIRHELARLFYDKIGNKIDPGAEYYKNQWAFRMMTYFDSGWRDELENLAAAAASIDELKKRPGVSEYADAARARDFDVFDFRKNLLTFDDRGLAMESDVKLKASSEIYYAYKRHNIEKDLKLDIKRMLYIDNEFGPLDWRLHHAHAIYWAAEETYEEFMVTGINYARIVRQCMIQAFYDGRLMYDRNRNIITRTNNLYILPKIHDFMDYLMHHQRTPAVDEIHRDFLRTAVAILYSYNMIAESRELFEHYREYYVKNDELDYDTFIEYSLEATLSSGSQQSKQSLIESSLYQSFHWLTLAEYDRSDGFANLAKMIWKRHQQKHQNDPAKLLPPFEQLVKVAKEKFVNESEFDAATFESRSKAARASGPGRINTGSFSDSHDHDHH